MPKQLKKLGIIAGSGELPRRIIRECNEKGRPVFVIAFDDITEAETVSALPHKWLHIGKVGEIIKTLKAENVSELILAGKVGRPPLSSLKMDFSAMKLLTKFAKLTSQGDDKIFSTIIKFLEDKGFNVIGSEDVLSDLLIKEGPIGSVKPDKIAQKDIEIGAKAAIVVGKLDIGQAVIVQQGQILGVEGAEGTDALMNRCKNLHNEGFSGVLVKMKKPGQDSRVDLPSIGIHTVNNAHAAGLRGIAVEAGGALVINRAEVIKRANDLGIFLVGIKPS